MRDLPRVPHWKYLVIRSLQLGSNFVDGRWRDVKEQEQGPAHNRLQVDASICRLLVTNAVPRFNG